MFEFILLFIFFWWLFSRNEKRKERKRKLFKPSLDQELKAIIEEEDLDSKSTKDFISQAFIEGEFKTAGTAITKLLPAKNMFSPDYEHSMQKSLVIQKLKAFFERFSNL